MTDNLESAKAKNELIDSVRDLYSAKITLPLGNPNLKLVHTNQFLFTELPESVFELANLDAISTALNSTYSRYSGYVLNRWYIEAITIANDGNKATMELDLNPFASTLMSFRDSKQGFTTAYNDAQNTSNTDTNKDNKNNNKDSTKKEVKSVSSDIKLKNVSGFKKSDQEFIKKVVTNALKAAKNPTSQVKQAKACHEYYKKHHVYRKYYDMPKMNAYGFKGCWNRSEHNCGDGAATLRAMFTCLNIPSDIFLGHSHYWVRAKINGKYYYCDQSGGGGQHNWRSFGSGGGNSNVWGGTSGGSIHNNY